MKMQAICATEYFKPLPERRKIPSTAVSPTSFILTLMASMMINALPALAIEQKSEPRMVNHAFSFGGMGIPENPGVEILNFQYGDSKATGTYAEDAWLAAGHVRQGGLVQGTMPVGDFLNVKWRILATGEVFEDRADLKGQLPSDMDHKIIHFTISDQQLSVYLIEGNTSAQSHAAGAADCPAAPYKPMKCTRIYPDHWANF